MRRLSALSTLRGALTKGLFGPQMLAFLPALCLSAYWVGGEALLVLCALGVPLIYATFGGAGHWFEAPAPQTRGPSLHTVAQEFLEIAQHNGQTTACLQITIPDIAQLTERLGSDASTEICGLLTARIKSSLRPSDHVFHDGKHQFTILISPGYRLRIDGLVDLGNRLRKVLESPVAVNGAPQAMSACIGIASSLSFGRNITAEAWLSSATDAMDEAVLAGHSATRLWSDRLSRHNKCRSDLQTDFIAALDQGLIRAVFQPQISVRTGNVVGMEAFARWEHPTRGVLTASEFLDAARDSGQLPRMGRTIFLQAVNALTDWGAAGFEMKSVSVNLSVEELRDPDIASRIKGDLERCTLPAHRVVFEVPETVLVPDGDDMTRRNITALAELGCRIDLDGFGTGGCNVIALQATPLTRVKLDKSLVRNVATAEDKKRALDALVGLCKRLELPILATGVESHEENGVLRELGCDVAQGHLFAEPASADDIKLWLADRHEEYRKANDAKIRRIK